MTPDAAAAVVPCSSTATCVFCTTVPTDSGSVLAGTPLRSAESGSNSEVMPTAFKAGSSPWLLSKVNFGSSRSTGVDLAERVIAARLSAVSDVRKVSKDPAAGSRTPIAM